MDSTMSPSSPLASSFLEPPLSTKRERQLHPARIASVPRAARTAPARSRYIHHRFQLQRPHLVSCLRGVPSDTILKSPAYRPDYDATYFDQVFQVIKVLGEGSFGQVVCVKSREDQRMYAVKRVIDPFRSESDRKVKLREVQKHELVPPHSNILEFFKAWEERGRLYIQTELCEQSLASYTEVYHPVPESEVWNYFIDICQAVNHLHTHDLLHMDIKPENILMTKDKICKLGDFGRVFDQKNDKKDVAEEGDSKYLALEILNNPPTKAADIFSVGMTILEIATDMELPSQGESWHHIREGSIPERFFANVSTELRGHIMHMINIDPNLRPTAKQLIQILSTTIRSRKKHIYVHEVKHKMMDFFFTASCIVLAVLAMLRELWHRFGAAIFHQNVPVPRTPVAARMPLQPVDNLDWGYSDEETSHHQHHHSYSQQHHHRSYTLSHPSSSSPTIVQQPTHHYPENPCPRYRLNFDDGEANSTTSNDSAGVSGQEHEGTPPGPFRSVVASGSSLRHETTMGPAGDWSQELENEFSDSDDEVFCRRGTMTAPPRLPVRSAYRSRGMRKPPPRLNLHLLDSPENEPQPKNRREKTPSPHRKMNGVATPARRKSRTSFQQRLISHEDSADEP